MRSWFRHWRFDQSLECRWQERVLMRKNRPQKTEKGEAALRRVIFAIETTQKGKVMEGSNRAIGLWESWHEKQNMLESVLAGVAAELDRKIQVFSQRNGKDHAYKASADEKLVLAMLKKTTSGWRNSFIRTSGSCWVR
ncbi:hypothetical protein CS542_08935 [Pedobacter sp. IW39]|nr:hypothetical protein CS542_08935 [Pedobacter sp. IW39]